MTKLLDKIINWGVIILVGLLPIFFLPLTSDFYEFNKNILLISLLCLLSLVWGVKIALEKKISFPASPFYLPLGLLLVIFLVSSFFVPGGKFESFWNTSILALLILLFFFVSQVRLEKEKILIAALGGGSLLSLLYIFQFFKAYLFPFSWAKTPFFTPAGSLLILAVFLVILLPLAITLSLEALRKNLVPKGTILLVATVLILASLSLSISQLFTSQKPLLLSSSAGWTIATGTMGSSFKNALLGSGPGTFLSSFTQFKPLNLNRTDFWNLRFTSSSNFYFQLLAEVGILGLAAFLWLILRIISTQIKQITTDQTDSLFVKSVLVSVILVFLITAFLPASFLLLFILFVLLGLLPGSPKEYTFNLPQKISLVPVITLVPLVFLIFYLLSRIYLADFYFQKSLVFASENKGTETYNFQIKALGNNPWVDRYRLIYSQTNLALADSLAGKRDLTDQERQMISQLVGQAIREARNATALSPATAATWENLGQIYRNLMGFAQGADQWAIASYNQAITLDPLNPRLRLELGGVFFSQENFDRATSLFSSAVNLKPDWANAYYNLGHAFESQGKLKEAAEQYKIARNLTVVDSSDYQKVSEEIAELEKRLPPEATPSAQPVPPEQPEALRLATPSAERQPLKPLEPPLEISTESGEIATPSSGR